MKPVYAETTGYAYAMDTRGLGMAVVGMGGGRRVATDTIDYAVGLSDMIRLGDEVNADTRWR